MEDEGQAIWVTLGVAFESGLVGRSGHSPMGGRILQMWAEQSEGQKARQVLLRAWTGLQRDRPLGVGSVLQGATALLLHQELSSFMKLFSSRKAVLGHSFSS